MLRLVDVDEIKKREKDVVLANGAKHRCFDTTMLYELPTVDAEPVRHGHWIGVSQTNMTILEKLFFPSRVFKCSVCGNYLDFDGVNFGRGSANYCPNCGAKMSRDEENKYEEPEINPCRRCEDYDGKGRCLSHGGCGEGREYAKMDNIVINNSNATTVTNNGDAMSTETRGETIPYSMMFPKTVDEFMEQYKIVDSDEIYTNGAELIPIFRMKQWFEHADAEEKYARVIVDEDGNMECSNCGSSFCFDNYCAHCGAKLIKE